LYLWRIEGVWTLTQKRRKRSGTSKGKSKDSTASKQVSPVTKEKPQKPSDMSKAELMIALEGEQRRLDDFRSRLAYLQAEYENSLKAAERREARLIQQSNRDLVLQLLPVLDDLERARVMVPVIEVNEPFIEGLNMVIKAFQEALQGVGVKPIECQGHTFDPLRHDAISHEVTSEYPPNMIIEELRRGYLLKGDLLRPSLVKIAIPPAEKEEKTAKRSGKSTESSQKSEEDKSVSTK